MISSLVFHVQEEHVKSLLLEQQRSSEFEERLKQQSMVSSMYQ